MKLLIAGLASLLMACVANAELLNLNPGSKQINGVNISTGATTTLAGQSYKLTTVGAGLRAKVVIFSIPVYVAQVMVSDPARFVKTASGALPSIDNQSAVAIRMTFLRDVDAQTIATAYQDSFDANNVGAKDSDIVHFMAAVTKAGDASNGGSLTILISKNADGSENLAYENAIGRSDVVTNMRGTHDLAHKILSIWLGNPADSGLADLKTQLLK